MPTDNHSVVLCIVNLEITKLMKHILIISLFIILFGQVLVAQQADCPKNPDPLYDRNEVQKKFAENLTKSMGIEGQGYQIKNNQPLGFAIFDLTNPSNKSFGVKCVDFIDGHIYHFSPIYFDQAESSIAVLESGKIKFFEKINCGDIDKKLKEVIDYVKQISDKYDITEQIIQRVANYRRYGGWRDRYHSYRGCKVSIELPKDKESSYSRYTVFNQMISVLYKNIQNELDDFAIWPVENERAIGFYVQDLVDLDNKQTNLLEFVHFTEGHVYLFGWIDAPYSITHFAVLKDGKIHLFEAIDCKIKEDGIDKLIDFIKENFKKENTINRLVDRVKNYKSYRASIEFEGKTDPICR